MDRAAREDDRRERGVCAAVNHELDLHAEQFAVLVDGRAMACARRMALRCSDHVFGAVVDDLHGPPARLPREQRGVARDHRRILFLATEAAAGLRLNHANLLFGQRE